MVQKSNAQREERPVGNFYVRAFLTRGQAPVSNDIKFVSINLTRSLMAWASVYIGDCIN